MPYSTGLPLPTNILAITPDDLGLDFVHQLHGFDDAKHLALFHGVAHFDEGRRARRRCFVVGADDRRLHDDQIGVSRIGAGRRMETRGRGAGPPVEAPTVTGAAARGCSRRQVHHGSRRAPALDVHLHVAAFEFELGDVLLNQQVDEFFNFFLIHRMCRKTAFGCSCRAATRTWTACLEYCTRP